MNFTKKSGAAMSLLKYTAAPALLMLAPHAAHASFIGTYAPANWSFSTTNGGDGLVDITGAPNSIFVQGGDNGAGGLGSQADYTIAAGASGIWSFDWQFTNFDTILNADNGGYLLNGVYTNLDDGAAQPFGGSVSGSVSIGVLSGDIIGFRADCADCAFGPGRLTISDFSAPSSDTEPPSVPEPSALALMGLGIAGLAAARLRRRVN